MTNKKSTDQPITPELEELRKNLSAELEKVGKENIFESDVVKVTEDKYLERVWRQVSASSGNQVDNAVKYLVSLLKWRKEMNVTEDSSKEENVSKAILERGSVFVRNRDVDGCRLFVLGLRNHVKGEFQMDDLKKVLVFFFERFEQEEAGKQVTIIFDCRDAGLKNIDLDFMRVFIKTLENYYPDIVNQILVLSMPWLLNAAFKLVKAMMGSAAVSKIHEVDVKGLAKYVDESNRLAEWDGKDTWSFSNKEQAVQ